MISANYLFLMTDVECLYTNNPRTDPNAKPIEVVEDISALKVDGMAFLPEYSDRMVDIEQYRPPVRVWERAACPPKSPLLVLQQLPASPPSLPIRASPQIFSS